MSRVSEFFFKQKCIPWRVKEFLWAHNIRQWWLRVQVTTIAKFVLREIPLDDVYTGGFNGDKQFDYEAVPVDSWQPNYRLRNSPHANFLEQYKDVEKIDNHDFKKTAYFRHGARDIKIYGDFFGILEEDQIIRRAVDFLSFYRAVRDQKCGKDYIFFPGDAHPRDCFLKVSKIPHSRKYMIREGHHRFAIYSALGYKSVKARVIGWTKISFEDMQKKENIYQRKTAGV